MQEYPVAAEEEVVSLNTSPHTLQPYVNYEKTFAVEAGPDKVQKKHMYYIGMHT